MTETEAARKRMIVICDDNAALAALMQHLLRKQGGEPRATGRGLDLLRATAPDLLLLDRDAGHRRLAVSSAAQGKRPSPSQPGRQAPARATSSARARSGRSRSTPPT
jgi:CheY-like chemotaxis protein